MAWWDADFMSSPFLPNRDVFLEFSSIIEEKDLAVISFPLIKCKISGFWIVKWQKTSRLLLQTACLMRFVLLFCHTTSVPLPSSPAALLHHG
jgi:hypothetical protein